VHISKPDLEVWLFLSVLHELRVFIIRALLWAEEWFFKGISIPGQGAITVSAPRQNQIPFHRKDFHMETLFPLGRCVITANAKDTLHPEDVKLSLDRHNCGDWGELCQDDWKENELSLAHGGRLFSRYKDRSGSLFYIITEHDRSVTTVLLPEDY
jgi:hypothetical protein